MQHRQRLLLPVLLLPPGPQAPRRRQQLLQGIQVRRCYIKRSVPHRMFPEDPHLSASYDFMRTSLDTGLSCASGHLCSQFIESQTCVYATSFYRRCIICGRCRGLCSRSRVRSHLWLLRAWRVRCRCKRRRRCRRRRGRCGCRQRRRLIRCCRRYKPNIWNRLRLFTLHLDAIARKFGS